MQSEDDEIKDIIARVNRIPVWSLPASFLAILGLGYFFTFYDISDIGLAMPAIATQFHIVSTSTILFIALSVGLIGYGIGSYIIGSTADVFGRYRSMILTMGLTALGSFGDAISVNVPELTIFRFITGLGLGADLNLVSTYISEFAPPAIRGKITVWAFLVGILGQSITPFVGLALVPVFYTGWRWLFGIGAIIAFVALILRFELPESPRWLATKKRDIPKARKVLELMERTALKKVGKLPEPVLSDVVIEKQKYPTLYLFRKPYSSRLALLVFVWFFWYIGNYAFLGDAATLLSSAGFTIASSILFLAVGAIGYPVGAAIMIAVADKFERKYIIFIDTVVWFVGLIIFSLKTTDAVFVGSFMASLALGMYLQVAYTYTAENYPTRARSSGFALTDGIGHVGGAFGALFLPFLVVTYSFSVGFIFIAVTGLIAGILVIVGGAKATRMTLEEVSA